MVNRSYYAADRRRAIRSRARGLTLTAIAGALVLAFGALATFTHPGPSEHHASQPWRAATRKAFKPYGGEPRLSESSTAPRAPWAAAVRFVRDYAAWEADRLPTLPSPDATERVIRLVEHAGRHRLGATTEVTRSVRMAASGARRYVVISVVGNFLILRQGSRWIAVSVPGD
jgi:hypothetical protein